MTKIDNFLDLILSEHVQKSKDSCAASGMEMVMKLEGLIKEDEYPFQEKNGDRNIGFSKLTDIKELEFTSHNCTYDDLISLIESESHEDRIILVSVHWGYFTPFLSILPNEAKHPDRSHIWIGVNGYTDCPLLCAGEEKDKVVGIKVEDLKAMYLEAKKIDSDYTFWCQTYKYKN